MTRLLAVARSDVRLVVVEATGLPLCAKRDGRAEAATLQVTQGTDVGQSWSVDVLLQQQVQWDITVAVVVRDGELYLTAHLDDPSHSLTRLTEPLHLVWGQPLVVAGRLPAGAVGVRSVEEGSWDSVEARSGVWLACAATGTPADPLSDLVFVRADGTTEPIPPPESEVRDALAFHQGLVTGTDQPEALPELSDEGRAYAATLAGALADDVARSGPSGPLRRAVIRWFWEGDPAYLTLHVLGADDEQPPAEDAWYPLEWANEEREIQRTDRVLARPEVTRAAEALTATFPRDRDGEVDGYAHVSAVEELVVQLPAAFAGAGIDLHERFAVSAAHFEGWGALGVLEGTATPALLKALADHGELPED